MYYIHYHNDFTIPMQLTEEDISNELIVSITFYTRNNGNTYCCSWIDKTLYKYEYYIYSVFNAHSLETGVLKCDVVYQIPNTDYPDKYQKVCKHYISNIELTQEEGDLTIETYQDYLSELKQQITIS